LGYQLSIGRSIIYTELIALLSGRTLDEDAAKASAIALDSAINDPEEWIADFDPQTIRQFAVEMVLFEYFLIGDKIDELHDLISDEFAEPLKPFPQSGDQKGLLAADYFNWLDDELKARPVQWELLSWQNGLDDNLHVVIVRRSDTDRILFLAETMGLRVRPAKNM